MHTYAYTKTFTPPLTRVQKAVHGELVNLRGIFRAHGVPVSYIVQQVARKTGAYPSISDIEIVLAQLREFGMAAPIVVPGYPTRWKEVARG